MTPNPDPRAVTARLNDPTVHTLSVPEAAVALHCSQNHAYRKTAEGEWPSIRHGRRVLMPAAWVRALLQIDPNYNPGSR